MAGHETTANALSWALYVLAQHPEVVQKIREEEERVWGTSGGNGHQPGAGASRYLQVVQEVMRLYPPAWIIGRRSLGEDQSGRYAFPADSYFLISPYTLHRRPEYWADPEVFNPDRFSEEQSKNRPTYAYLPFGGGPRLCVGNDFALMEMQLVLETSAGLRRAADHRRSGSGAGAYGDFTAQGRAFPRIVPRSK